MDPYPINSPQPSRLLTLSAELAPALAGRLGDPKADELVLGTNLGPIAPLLEQLRRDHPEAGRHYWTMRCWTQLTWQPVMLSLLAAERLGCMLDLDRLGQRCENGLVAGYSLADGALVPVADAVVPRAGQTLLRGCEELLATLATCCRLNPTLAWRLLADRVLATVLRLFPGKPLIQRRQAQTWLAAMDLTGASALMGVPLPDGRERLALDRKGCCQRFRRHDGKLCSTCPRLSRAERIQRLQQP